MAATYRGVPVMAVVERLGASRAMELFNEVSPLSQRELWLLFQMATCHCCIGRVRPKL